MWRSYHLVNSLSDAAELLANGEGNSRIVAGATDLILEIERGVRHVDALIDISRVENLNRIELAEDGLLHLGPLVTHNDCVASPLIRRFAFPLAKAAFEVGSPQIRNRGTVAGNIITASPANDTITPLMALGARVKLFSTRGERVVPLDQFYRGVRRTVMASDEILVDIAFPPMTDQQSGTFIKLALRNAQAISLVNLAVLLTRDTNGVVEDARLTLGAVAPTIYRALEAEQFLHGKTLTEITIGQAAQLVAESTRPIDDVRGSAVYRKNMARVITSRALTSIVRCAERDSFPPNPPLLQNRDGQDHGLDSSVSFNPGNSIIETHINGVRRQFKDAHQKSLLRLLREDGLLTGTKEGCAEGECGACTVFLDGMAVMSCMVPAGRAHGASIVTIEGISQSGRLHPVQEAFISQGAVQCGYCTPGFILSAVKLLEEYPHPTEEQIQQAITGNLCRCTGYYKIIKAIEVAADVGGA